MKRSQGKKDRAKKCCNEMLIQPERSDCPRGGNVPQHKASVQALEGVGVGGGRGTKLPFKPRPLNSKHCFGEQQYHFGQRSSHGDSGP